VQSITKGVACALLASVMSIQSVPAMAQKHKHRDRYEDRWDRDRRDDDRRYDERHARREWRDYDAGRVDGQRYYDPARYYRSGPDYRPYRMGPNDRVYRGYVNRYYCRRDDGTTGLIVGGMAGGVLGQIIAPGGYKTLGVLLGAGAGALVGRAVDDGVECR
jgi:hypothetical protein